MTRFVTLFHMLGYIQYIVIQEGIQSAIGKVSGTCLSLVIQYRQMFDIMFSSLSRKSKVILSNLIAAHTERTPFLAFSSYLHHHTGREIVEIMYFNSIQNVSTVLTFSADVNCIFNLPSSFLFQCFRINIWTRSIVGNEHFSIENCGQQT